MPSVRLHLDFETSSEVDLKNSGVYVYAADRTTKAVLLGWAIDDEFPRIWDIAAGEDMPNRLRMALADSMIHAHNATFERLILRDVLKIDIPASRFRCTQVKAYSLGFSGSLNDICEQVGLSSRKSADGGALIRRFSIQRKPPEGDLWQRFKNYCLQDVIVERELGGYLAQYPDPTDIWENYAVDQSINDSGLQVDRRLVSQAIRCCEMLQKDLIREAKELTGLDNPNSRNQMLSWLETAGRTLPDLAKETVDESISRETDPKILRALRLRKSLAKTSVKKWKAFEKASGADSRVRGMFQYLGASRTGRWAGRLVQLQNMPRGGEQEENIDFGAAVILEGYLVARMFYGDGVSGLLSDVLRGALVSSRGVLNVSDLSSIESRVLGWVTGCRAINEIFANNLDTYKVFATKLYRVPYEKVTKAQRKFCKPPVLGGGFGLGGPGLVAYAKGMGVDMSEPEAKEAIEILRREWWEVVEFWGWCKDAVFYTTRTGKPFQGRVPGLYTELMGDFLLMRLPSGRYIAYHKPAILPRRAPWGEMIDSFTFMGMDRTTMKWFRVSASPGFLTENIVQALARDILMIWINRARDAWFNVIGHVHDEIICDEASDRLEELNSLIRQPIRWAPGLLLDSAGYTAKRYRKE